MALVNSNDTVRVVAVVGIVGCVVDCVVVGCVVDCVVARP